MPTWWRISSAARSALLRKGGCFGLIATNTIGQGDTRASGLRADPGGAAARSSRRGAACTGRERRRWSSAWCMSCKGPVREQPCWMAGRYGGSPLFWWRAIWTPLRRRCLPTPAGVPGQLSCSVWASPSTMSRSERAGEPAGGYATADRQGRAERRADLPYLGGEEVNDSPTHAHHRWEIDFNDFRAWRRERMEREERRPDGGVTGARHGRSRAGALPQIGSSWQIIQDRWHRIGRTCWKLWSDGSSRSATRRSATHCGSDGGSLQRSALGDCRIFRVGPYDAAEGAIVCRAVNNLRSRMVAGPVPCRIGPPRRPGRWGPAGRG